VRMQSGFSRAYHARIAEFLADRFDLTIDLSGIKHGQAQGPTLSTADYRGKVEGTARLTATPTRLRSPATRTSRLRS